MADPQHANPLDDLLARVHARFRDHADGETAAFVKALGTVDETDFGIALTTVDGHTYTHGQATTEFAIQSISKAFTYAVALADSGFEAVDAVIDVEPSGEAFNEISLQEGSGRPSNAMINAGAIAATSLVAGRSSNPYVEDGASLYTPDQGASSHDETTGRTSAATPTDGTRAATPTGGVSADAPTGPREGETRRERLRRAFSTMADRELTVNPEVLAFEREDGDRNLALAHLMRSFGLISEGPEAIADDYFAACSIDVTVTDLSMMATLLATGGIHPRTGRRLLDQAVVDRVLGVMTTCGMYDDAGEWIVRVGLPAKSGVGGGIIAVVPGQVGLAVYSPLLDQHGNSERGVLACEALSDALDLHLMRGARVRHAAVRSSYPVSDTPSGVRRAPAAERLLTEHGDRSRVVEIQGELGFGPAESVMRQLSRLTEVDAVVLDVRRVTEVTRFAREGLVRVAAEHADEGRLVVLVDDSGHVFTEDATERLTTRTTSPPDGSRRNQPGVIVRRQRRAAIEAVEDFLLSRHGDEDLRPETIEVSDAILMTALDPADVEQLEEIMRPRTHREGDVIIEEGQDFAGIHVVVTGSVQTTHADEDDEEHRVNVLGPGSSFGEFGLVGDHRHWLTVTALEEVETRVLDAAALARLEEDDPRLALRLWKAISADAYHRVQVQLAEITARASEAR
ncbi:L-glutaminase [Kytococcus aerolatus]|uniref:Glutaminase n=1 Tax=Kytococcus aerolatus TaxID=592308 RepID=A0A212TGD4_9MICO|nr:glutaminase [Kytococcus aerolatus]SNC65117.1 L-glutaminase [Kytococcus aerolatus]